MKASNFYFVLISIYLIHLNPLSNANSNYEPNLINLRDKHFLNERLSDFTYA